VPLWSISVAFNPNSGLGSVVVFATTIFALWMGVTNGAAAIVIVQAGIFAEASRQLVKCAVELYILLLQLMFFSQGCCSTRA
jgi:hypothetical protein